MMVIWHYRLLLAFQPDSCNSLLCSPSIPNVLSLVCITYHSEWRMLNHFKDQVSIMNRRKKICCIGIPKRGGLM